MDGQNVQGDESGRGGRISRRQALKRGAVVGGALVWAPPLVDSLTARAFAAGSPPPAGPGGGDPVPCACGTAVTDITNEGCGAEFGSGSIRYKDVTLEAVTTPSCGGQGCTTVSETVVFSPAPGGTAVHAVLQPDGDTTDKQAVLRIQKPGHASGQPVIDVCVTSTVECSDGSTCSTSAAFRLSFTYSTCTMVVTPSTLVCSSD